MRLNRTCRGVSVVALLGVSLLSGCARYEYVNELDVPGLCPSEEELHVARQRAPRLAYERVAAAGDGVLRGRIVEADPTGTRITDRPIRSAQVHLVGSGRGVSTDSIGQFGIAVPEEGPYVLRAQGLGFVTRVDTVHAPLPADTAVVIALRVVIIDGPCSGLAAVRVRKPWWKWW